MSDFSVSEFMFDCLTAKGRVFCYGATEESALLLREFPGLFQGVIDRKYRAGENWNNVQCSTLDDVNDKDCVINCVVAANAWGVMESITARTLRVMHFFDFVSLTRNNPQFEIESLSPILQDWARFPSVFLQHLEFFYRFSECLSDIISRQVYQDYLDARLSGDILKLGQNKVFEEPSRMYFQDFLPELHGYVFIDIGAFDGANSAAFLERYNDVSVLCAEPDPENVVQVKQSLQGHEANAEILPVLIGDVNDVCNILPKGPSTSKVSIASEASIQVQQRTLDDVYQEHRLAQQKIFLKIDVEGAEDSVLKGASEFLKGSDNILALSVYHKSDDLVNLWPLIETFAEGKRVSFRHLTTGACETVLFVY